MPGIPPGLLVLLLGNSVITKYNAIAAATWLVWDFFISIEDEVELIWKSRNSLPKYLYFFSRYFGMFMQVFLAAGAQPLYCKEWLVFEAITFALTVTAVEISMILRIQALYGGSRTVLVLLLSVLAVEILCFSIITVIGYRAATPSLRPFPEQWPIKGCIMTKIPKIFELCWLPTLICESLLFSLTAYKCLASGPRFRSGFHTPTHVKFFRDGIVYYALTFVALLFYTVSWHISRTRLASAALIWMGSAVSYSGSHLLLGLRKVVAHRRASAADVAVDAGLAYFGSADAESGVCARRRRPSKSDTSEEGIAGAPQLERKSSSTVDGANVRLSEDLIEQVDRFPPDSN